MESQNMVFATKSARLSQVRQAPLQAKGSRYKSFRKAQSKRRPFVYRTNESLPSTTHPRIVSHEQNKSLLWQARNAAALVTTALTATGCGEDLQPILRIVDPMTFDMSQTPFGHILLGSIAAGGVFYIFPYQILKLMDRHIEWFDDICVKNNSEYQDDPEWMAMMFGLIFGFGATYGVFDAIVDPHEYNSLTNCFHRIPGSLPGLHVIFEEFMMGGVYFIYSLSFLIVVPAIILGVPAAVGYALIENTPLERIVDNALKYNRTNEPEVEEMHHDIYEKFRSFTLKNSYHKRKLFKKIEDYLKAKDQENLQIQQLLGKISERLISFLMERMWFSNKRRAKLVPLQFLTFLVQNYGDRLPNLPEIEGVINKLSKSWSPELREETQRLKKAYEDTKREIAYAAIKASGDKSYGDLVSSAQTADAKSSRHKGRIRRTLGI